jgi:formylglycine-generating enzyme required for sulfatase activity
MREEEIINGMTMTSANWHNRTNKPPFENMVWIPGGTFLMGSDKHYPEEAPAHEVTVEGFWMDEHTVTNEEFRKFVEATKHVTSAERAPKAEDYPGAKPELLVPASVVFNKPRQRVDLRDCYNWWIYVPGANWRHPEGPASSLKGKAKHPVVHVAYEDVEAYAKWIGKELPTESEWEFAARGGLNGAEFVWGDAFTPNGKQMANTWQGEFPWQNLKEDGFEGTAPVGSIPQRPRALRMAGNVWGVDRAVYQEHKEIPQSAARASNPRGGGTGQKAMIQHARHQNPAQSNERRRICARRTIAGATAGGAHAPAHRYFNVSSGLRCIVMSK